MLCSGEEPPQIIINLAKRAIWTRENKVEVTNFTGLKVDHMASLATVRLYIKADNYEAT